MEHDPELELVAVTLSVPRGRVGDLYRKAAELNDADPTTADPKGLFGGILPWGNDDAELARQLYGMVSDNARRILDELMEMGGAGAIGGAELAKKAGIDKGAYGVAGSLSSVGKAAAKVSRELPYRATPNMAGGPGIYGMDEKVCALFQKARADREGRSS
jgi:hypothetical protein